MALLWSFLTLALYLLSFGEAVLVRKNVDTLSGEDILNLQKSLREVADDTSSKGYASIAAYHGYPAQCKHKDHDVACCIHGMSTFPQWHRLFVVQLEQALKEKGLGIGIPYWDWTRPVSQLPDLVSQQVFIEDDGGKAKKNVWYQGDITVDGQVKHTARAVDNRLFQKVGPGEFTDLFEQVLNALEFKDYCQFEVQFEVAHNTIHYLVGGRNKYSMSHLEYTSYDPIFFLHHSNVDKIYAIYDALQKERGYSSGGNCDVQSFGKSMEPFSWESNPFKITKDHSKPKDALDYADFGYKYDELTLNGLNLDGLKKLIKDRSERPRAFAAFRLNGIGTSANVRVQVCIPSTDTVTGNYCVFAGDFFVLGGPLEMPWAFSRPFYFDVTEAVESLNVKLTGNYRIEAELYSVNGTRLSSDLLPNPYVSYRPGVYDKDPSISHNDESHLHDFHKDVAVRKDVDRLTREEVLELREALEKFQNDKSVDGYQAIAEFHGEPGKCPNPTAKDRKACCIHGMPTFPHWHRLLVVQVEDALRRRGATVGIPYWDWTKPNTKVPGLAGDAEYVDPKTKESHPNPFYQADIAFKGVKTGRDVKLNQVPTSGDHTELFDAFLLALEQENFCDFEVQFEIAHNLIHALVGGNNPYSLSTLSYSAFDPIFYLHHSNVDRIWAIWTALQELRGKPYKAHCAQSYTYEPLKPFAFSSPYNNNNKTFAHSVPTKIYDYEEELQYTYDSLQYGGLTVRELYEYINNRKTQDRVFAGLLLWGIKTSGIGHIFIEAPGKEKFDAGRFAILGGPSEMAWRLDRLYKHEITDSLKTLGLNYDDDYKVTLEIHLMDGTAVDASQFPEVQIIRKTKKAAKEPTVDLVKTRHNVETLTNQEKNDLRKAMANLQADHSASGYQDLGRYHGTPKWCPSPDAEVKKSCCLHGMPTFPHWHRLWTVQAENALRRHGYSGALPYWDWTLPLSDLPELVTSAKYTDAGGKESDNPFFSANIDDINAKTTRAPRADLFKQPEFGGYTAIAKQVLLALEQDNFCDFEVQFEIAHNFIHALVGGNEPNSMASLMWTAFDPLFYLHHANTDRIWAIWQALQKYRNKPYLTANCALGLLRKPLSPFSLTSDINPDSNTRDHSKPSQVFDYRQNFHYEYDNLEFNGLSIAQLSKLIEKNKAEDRVFAGFMLHGIKQSALVKFQICKTDSDCSEAGEFYILGDVNEMEWSYDRLYKYEITDQLNTLDLHYNDRYSIKYTVYNLNGDAIGTDTFSTASVLYELGTSHLYGQEFREHQTAASHVRRNLEDLSSGEIESLRSAFLAIQKDGTYENIAAFHGKPGLCEYQGRKIACCVHGMPTFPAWHRLYVEQVEEALLDHGSAVAVPYWDWTTPFSKLPKLISSATYYNSRAQRFDPNPFFSGSVKGENVVTTRDPQPGLFNNDDLYDQVLYAFEQDHFCDFEIQFELIHNALHSLVGGRAQYSLSSLDYSAFDPVFFLHHANTDRIWAIWQELQRYRGLPYNEADCAINLMRKPLHPFDLPEFNKNKDTARYNRPADTFDYRNHFQYEYDSLEFNHMTIPQLENLLKRRQENGRVFAGFLLHNIGLSATVDIYVCVFTDAQHKKKSCNHKAGTFYVLGGELEMPFSFDRLYKYDITKTVRDLGLKLDNAANFELKIDINAVNGSLLNDDLLPRPSILYEPGTNERQKAGGEVSSFLVRKEISSLSPRESLSLYRAMAALQQDSSADGWQSLASFHAIPPLCPHPSASDRYACCLHGMATFPHWHRLYTVQIEDALRRHGALVGVPYWDWTRVDSHLPEFIDDETYPDPVSGESLPNPWKKSKIDFENSVTERDVVADKLFKRGPHGWDTWLFEQALFALEQEDYCDFEIQFEITHNAIHSWIGGSKEHSLGHLHYASYDPAFFVHHSNVDRLWAVWQALQKFRGHDPNEANCALEQMKEPLKPFSFGSPYNLNEVTKEKSRPEDVFNYEQNFNYRYDSLEFVGMSIPQLDAYIKEKTEHERVFAGFLLKGFGASAFVNFDICANQKCTEAGYFTVLGGKAEMPWQFDRLFKYEITEQLKSRGLRFDDEYEINVHVKSIDGKDLGNILGTPSVIYVPAKHDYDLEKVTHNFVRRDVNSLSERDLQTLKAALRDLQLDNSNDGWTSLASFHGAPAKCKDGQGKDIACCVHGMPTFPHWHRLFTVQIEQALQRHGSAIAVPYWDWTLPITELPKIFTDEDYYDAWRDEVVPNPFARGFIPSISAYTVRDIRPELYRTSKDGSHSELFELVLSALEQTDYCDFEVQYEVMHNAIHYLVGGEQTYSLSSLEYSAYDPIFFIHHAFIDKVWIIWQELQQRRRLPSLRADCALNYMNEPMKPFSMDININPFTKKHAVPNDVFNHEHLGYQYDNLKIGGHSIDDLERIIADRQKTNRIFAGFLLKGVGTSGSVVLNVCKEDKKCNYAGRFNLLGGPTEMPWAFDRLYKKDITWAIQEAGVEISDSAEFNLDVKVFDVHGTAVAVKDVFPTPSIIYVPAKSVSKEAASTKLSGAGVRKEVSSLSVSEVNSLRQALQRVKDDKGPNGFASIAAFHGFPGLCKKDGEPIACCVHGMANFPQWHRLYVKQWEDALTAQGAKVGIPYWDWTAAFKELPSLVTDEKDNPFHHGDTPDGHKTSRSPRDQLFNDPEFGSESFFYRQALLTFEQTDYCDFEVQFEITHNAIHSWTGGSTIYGMSTLGYTSYDPLFLIHHSNVDRQFAIWQALQKYRGLPYNSANCAIQHLRKPMEPFSWDSNINPVTRANAKAIDAFDYDRLNYQYDNLNFHGLTIAALNDLLEARKAEDRIFAEFLLKGFQASADVRFNLCDSKHHCEFAGTFAVLGGPLEMPWAFDRLFKYDVTNVFNKLNLKPDSDYHFDVEIVLINGTKVDSNLIRSPSVQFVPGVKRYFEKVAEQTVQREDKLVRKNVNQLTLDEATNLRNALNKLQQDQGPNGFEALAGFHGAPFKCPEQGDDKYACCVHGMPVFPHWHRLFTVQVEQALKANGALVGVPYWDWTAPVQSLPSLFGDSSEFNPFYSFFISSAGQKTTRDVQKDLFNPRKVHGHDYLFYLALTTLEEDNYCDFEVQYEVLHNEIHALIGGSGIYSMSTLDYSSFDPFFMIHHSSIDRIWILWQELQKLRNKPFNAATCAGNIMERPLQPFSYPDVNKNEFTRLNSVPSLIFDAERLGYRYDKLELNGYDVEKLNQLIDGLQHTERIFAGIVFFGRGKSLTVDISVYDQAGQTVPAGKLHVLGGEKEMPWAYERLMKVDITEAIKTAGISTDKAIKVKYGLKDLAGKDVEAEDDFSIIVERHADADYDIVEIPIGRDTPLPPKIVLKKGTRVKFYAGPDSFTSAIENLGSYTSFSKCSIPPFSYQSYKIGTVYTLEEGDYFFVAKDATACKAGKKIQISIED